MSFAITVTNVSPSITINTASTSSVTVTNKSTPTISIKRDGTGPQGQKGDPGESIVGPQGEQGIPGATGPGAAWGSMTGTLASQVDLATALAAKVGTTTLTTALALKADASSLGTAAFKNTGTTGNVVALVDGNNLWTGAHTFQSATNLNINLKSNGGTQTGIINFDAAGNYVFRGTTGGSMFFDSYSGAVYFRNYGAGSTVSVVIDGVGNATFSGKLAATNKTDGVSITVRGKSANGERHVFGKATYAFVVTAARCSAEASIAATATTVYTLKPNRRNSGQYDRNLHVRRRGRNCDRLDHG
jgi:hypothetical protein